jgi:hypothetical protein
MSPERHQDGTLLSTLTEHLRACSSTSDGIAPPAVIVWTDPKGQWRSLVPTLLASIPELLVCGDYDPGSRTGPAIWLRCMIDRALENPTLPEDTVPILYLPGVGRQQLRAGEECLDALKPLVELMYRGTLLLQKGGHDWTVTAFMTSPNGLALELSGDDLTTEALLRALPEFASEPIRRFRGQRLEAADFDQMLADDVVRDLLLWMNNPAGTRERLGKDRWAAFRNQSKKKFGFDPNTDGETSAGERLGAGEGAWASPWDRFVEAPANYPGIPDLLRRSKPGGLIFDPERWPDENDKAEEDVRKTLARIKHLSQSEACTKVLELESHHAKRRSWIWNRLGQSPMAQILAPLAELARHTKLSIGGQTPDDIARTYIGSGWQADRASWQVVAMAPVADQGIVRGVVQHLLKPWLDDCARAFQTAMNTNPLPNNDNAAPITVTKGVCLLFADGLRYDLGEVLRDRLGSLGYRVRIDYRWAALPTVTATAKPAITPIAADITGTELPDDFSPMMSYSQKPANAAALRSALEKKGCQLLSGGMGDWPASDEAWGWTEEGKFDTRGHQLQADLAGFLDEELDRLADRIISLLDGGWASVHVVTDHGWLLLPEGLPKVDLPKHLTKSKWARCAAIAGNAQVDVPTAPWHWNTAQRFATGPGIACFTASNCYAHGGLSIQECLTPDLLVERAGDTQERASIESVAWKGMRCLVVASSSGAEVKADLRLATPAGASVAASTKTLDGDGSTSLLLEDDEHETADLVVVLLSSGGSVLAQHKTKVGIDS